MNKVSFELNSTCPLILHNGHLADPSNKWARQIKEISGKRKKVDADFAQMAKLEWYGGLYVGETGKIIIPSELLYATIINGAKKSKEGMIAKQAMFITQDALLNYGAAEDIDELWKDKRFVFTKGVVVNRARIMRTRPIFPRWSCEVSIEFNPELCNLAQIERWVRDAGQQVGVGTWRPQHGRFDAVLLGNGVG